MDLNLDNFEQSKINFYGEKVITTLILKYLIIT